MGVSIIVRGPRTQGKGGYGWAREGARVGAGGRQECGARVPTVACRRRRAAARRAVGQRGGGARQGRARGGVVTEEGRVRPFRATA